MGHASLAPSSGSVTGFGAGIHTRENDMMGELFTMSTNQGVHSGI